MNDSSARPRPTAGCEDADDLLARVVDVVEADLAIDVSSVETDLVAEGVLDSLGLVTLLVSIEEEFGITIPRDSFTPEIFRTPTAIADCVRGRSSS